MIMKVIKKELVLVFMAAAFLGSYIGNAKAKEFYYYENLPGLMSADSTFPFCDLDDCTYDSAADIDLSITERLVTSNSSTQVSNTYNLTINDGSSVSLTAISSDETIVASADITALGGVITIPAAAIKKDGDLSITLNAYVDGTIADIDYFNVEISDFNCSGNPLGDIYYDGSDYLIGKIIAGDTPSSTVARQQFLCLSNIQNTTTLGADYKLTADIEFDKYSNEDWNSDGQADGASTEGLNPFGHGRIGYSSSTAFKGTFDGQGNSITNLYINRGDTNNIYHDNIGLFGWIDGAEIKNINVVNPYVFGRENVGGLIGLAESYSIITGIAVTGSGDNKIEGYRSVGGMIGHASSASSTGWTTVDDTMTDIDVSCSYKSAGGLISRAGSIKLTNSYTLGDVHSDGMWAGGLFGTASSIEMENCYTTGTITAGSLAGGLVGSLSSTYLVGSPSTYPGIKNCYSSANVSGGEKIGGISGYAGFINFENVYANGTIIGTSHVGGLSGYIGDNSSVVKSYSSATVVGGSSAGGIVGYSSPYQWLKLYDVFYNGPSVSGTSSIGGLIGYGSKISDIQRSYVDSTITSSGSSAGGLIGYGNSATIDKCYSKGSITSGNLYAGGLIGKSTITTISESYSEADVIINIDPVMLASIPPAILENMTLGSYAGGLVGSIYSGTISDSYFDGDVIGVLDYASGIVGYTTSTNSSKTTDISNTYNIGTISSEDNIGSIISGVENDYLTITNTSGLCDPDIGLEEACSSPDAITINSNWSGTSWDNQGSSSSPTLGSSIMPTSSWDSAAWNLGSSKPTLKNMPN